MLNRKLIVLSLIAVVAAVAGFALGRITAPGPNPRFIHVPGVTGFSEMFDNRTGKVCSTLTHGQFLSHLQAERAERKRDPLDSLGVPAETTSSSSNPIDDVFMDDEAKDRAAADHATYCADLAKGW